MEKCQIQESARVDFADRIFEYDSMTNAPELIGSGAFMIMF